MKRNQLLLLLVLFISSSNLIAQKQKLSIKESIIYASNKFSPSNIYNTQWIPNTSKFSYIKAGKEGYKTLIAEVEDISTVLMSEINIEDPNNILLSPLNGPVLLNWIDENTAYFKQKMQYYKYTLSSNTIEKWHKLPKYSENIHFNKGYTQVSYTINNNLFTQTIDTENLNITSFDNENIVAGQSVSRNEFGIEEGQFWSSKDKYLAFYQKDESNVTDYPFINPDAIPTTYYTVKYPMAGQLSEKTSVGVYNASSKEVTYLKTDTNFAYVTNVSWSLDDKFILVALLNRGQDHYKMCAYNPDNGELLYELFEEKSDSWLEPHHAPFFIPGTDNEFLWFSDHTGYNHIYRYNAKGKLLNAVTKGDYVVTKLISYKQSSKEIFYQRIGDKGDELNFYVYKKGLKGKKSIKLTKEEGVHNVLISSDGNFAIDNYSASDVPRQIDVIDIKSDKINHILTAENPLANVEVGTTEIVTIKAADGKTDLYGRLIKPSNFDANKKYPVLVYVYGGPRAQLINNSWLNAASLWMHQLASEGYIVFTLDNRGSENRGRDFEHVIYRDLGTNEIEDQMKGVEYLKAQSFVDTTKMAVNGWSFGGYMTISLMLKKPGTFDVGVAGGPVTNWRLYEIMYGERYMDTPQENPEGYENTTLANYVDNLEGKLLMIHGEQDDVVLPQHADQLLKAFIKAEKQTDFFLYPTHHHNVYGIDRAHLFEKILGYIKQNLE